MSTRRISTIAGTAALIVLAIFLAEAPPFSTMAAWIDAREPKLLLGVGVVLALGFGLFLGGILQLLMDHGEAASHAEIESSERSVRIAPRPVTARESRYRVFGAAAGRRGAESFDFRELKAAWRSGAVWHDRDWRRRFVTIAGALLMIAGICGVPIVAGAPWLKVLFGGALLYVLGRLTWGLWRS